jgi:hypothetical protein
MGLPRGGISYAGSLLRTYRKFPDFTRRIAARNAAGIAAGESGPQGNRRLAGKAFEILRRDERAGAADAGGDAREPLLKLVLDQSRLPSYNATVSPFRAGGAGGGGGGGGGGGAAAADAAWAALAAAYVPNLNREWHAGNPTALELVLRRNVFPKKNIQVTPEYFLSEGGSPSRDWLIPSIEWHQARNERGDLLREYIGRLGPPGNEGLHELRLFVHNNYAELPMIIMPDELEERILELYLSRLKLTPIGGAYRRTRKYRNRKQQKKHTRRA